MKTSYLTIVLLLSSFSFCYAVQPYFTDTYITPYSPAELTPSFPHNYKSPYIPVDSAYNLIGIRGFYPYLGYPSVGALFEGMNDTLQVSIQFMHVPNKAYVFGTSDPEEWYVPGVYEIEANIYDEPPRYDASQLGYRIRGWKNYAGPISKPDTVRPYVEMVTMLMDVWNLPKGIYRLVVIPTDSIPPGFYGQTGGDVFDYREARSLSDSINAWSECFWRLYSDGKNESANSWVDSILTYNSKSSIGYALRAKYYWAKKDSAGVINSYNSAISYLENLTDPLIPDTSAPYKMYLNKRWYEHLLDICEDNRYTYMNNPDVR